MTNPYKCNHEPRLGYGNDCPACAWEQGSEVSGTQLNRSYADGFEDGAAEVAALRLAATEAHAMMTKFLGWVAKGVRWEATEDEERVLREQLDALAAALKPAATTTTDAAEKGPGDVNRVTLCSNCREKSREIVAYGEKLAAAEARLREAEAEIAKLRGDAGKGGGE